MNVTAAAIRNNRVTFLTLLVILMAGFGAYRALPRAEDPGFTIRTALVRTYFPGASPERVELLVTDKLEKRIQEMPEVDFLSSESRTGVSYLFVNIQSRYTEMRPIWDSLRRKVDAAGADLPDGVIGPFVDDEFGDVFPVMVTLTGDGFDYAELREIADEVRDELLLKSQIAKVAIYGAQEERIFVEYNNARLSELGLSPGQLKNILESRNIIIPGGSIILDREQIALEPSGNFESIDDLKRTIIQVPGRPEVVYLEDLATVTRGYVDPPTSRMHADGTPCLGLSVSMRSGGNVIELGEQVEAVVNEARSEYPIGIEFEVPIFQPKFVDEQVRGFVGNLFQAMAIVLLVMLVSLGPRTGLVVAALIPTTMLLTLLLMQTMHIGLDQISIAALIIALGMLVDNAIVMSESIMVQIAAGKDRFQAAVDSANELRIPLLTSSLTTSAAFLPIFLAESETGEYTASLFKVVTIALLASWVLSLTMMPLLCMLFIKVKVSSEAQSFDSRFYRAYRGFLVMVVRRRFVSLLVVAGVFALSLFGMRFVPAIFFPDSDSPKMLGELDLPVGTPLARANEVAFGIERFLQGELVGDDDAEGLLSWTTYVGQGGGPRYRLSYNPAQGGSEHISMIFTATGREYIDGLIPRLEAFCQETYPELVSSFQAEALGPPVESPIQVRVSGRDAEALFAVVDRVKERLSQFPAAVNVEDNWGPRVKKIRVEVNQARARRAGVTSQDVAISLQSGLSGIQTTEFREGDEIIPIVLRSVAADRQDPGKLESLNVFVQATGASVPLKQIADVVIEWEPSKILRRQRLKTVTVECDLTAGVTASDVNAELVPWLEEDAATWPRGYGYELGGEAESSAKANQAIGAKLPIAGFLILLLLVAQFNSVRRTVIIFTTIPLGMIGVTIGLLLAHSSFGFMTLLGVISLAGIIINNAIVLLDRIRIEIDENGLDAASAVIESAQQRLRPILLTTATTVGGLLPLWFAGGPMWQPMAVAIIFGLTFATALTLCVVPLLYSLFFRVSFKEYRYLGAAK
ncbi:MAG: efflux RND transporter permease subunit [Candidatus Eisenbacteria bacterium]|uniref:Efflux RND transporter permease subunit n=1 Tax=Eiseniibacteriota bacterium TaxID=2212470 RepID=A0A956NJ35_UNCEI|nr:efflux RND transporter permease subunit [Candidatus Eisenbacteria bacterium]MCB9464252.1 efflux RND transporter permease subunit [Candidatus Eisenbacteria bacterium]